MANRLRSVTVKPSTTPSGKAVSIKVGYDSSDRGSLTLSCSPAFRVAPKSVACPRDAQGSIEFDLTITRIANQGPVQCMVLFGFFSDERRRLVEVT
jgi:hypothetical protein